MKIIVYSTSTCPFCIQVKDFLKENKIEFEDIDISQNTEAAKEIAEKSGQMGVPVIDIDGQLVIGFDKEKLKQLLKL